MVQRQFDAGPLTAQVANAQDRSNRPKLFWLSRRDLPAPAD